jgi:siroheme synthase
MKIRNVVLKYGAPVVVAAGSFAGTAMADAGPDYSAITGVISFAAVIAAAGLVYAAIAGYKVFSKGAKLLMASLS